MNKVSLKSWGIKYRYRLIPWLSPQKRGKESLVTLARKGIDIWYVIIYVINAGWLINIIVMLFSKLPYDIGTVPVATQSIYNFTFHPRSICNSVEFHDKPFTCKFKAVQCDEWAGPVKPATMNFDLRIASHLKTVFHQLLRCSLLKSSFSTWQFFAEWTKRHVHMVLFRNLFGTTEARCQKSTTLLTDVTRLSPPPILEERAWEWG